ncbi:recombinase family protein [Massilia agri]
MYVRASTEHQNYSTTHQEAALDEYAASHSFSIIKTYCDKGRSGLTLEGRAGLLQLLRDIQSGEAEFKVVLVYDVSRWGRFQDVDESAYYEFACRRAGIAVAYCAEPFSNDGSPLATVLKGLKRAMAAEYSRELSAKVFHAQARLTQAGFKQGGTAGFGLRRMAISAAGQPKGILGPGERKNMPSDRVTYVPGSHEEVAVIHRIYDMYLVERMPDVGIVARLNSEGISTGLGRPWSAHLVKQILTNEKYIGTMTFNRGTQRMRTARRSNDPSKWVRREEAFEGIVTRERFDQAVAERKRRRRHWTSDEMLDELRDIMVKHGKVTADLINASDGPAVKSYALRFNGLASAMGLAGVSWPSLSQATITRYRLRCVTREVTAEFVRCAVLAKALIECLTPRTWRLNGVTVRLLCTRCRYERSHPCWKVTVAYEPAVDFVVWVRMDQANTNVARIYLIPLADFPTHQYLWPSNRTLPYYEKYAHPTLAGMFGLT